MKKIVMLLVILLAIATSVSANEARQKELIAEFEKNNQVLNEYTGAIERIKSRQSEIVGAVKELDRIAKEAKADESTKS